MIDDLAKLGFSFWQLVVLVLAFSFRNEVKKLLSRLSQVKAGNAEFAFNTDDSKEIEDLKNIKDSLEDESQTKESVKNLLEEKITERALDAVLNIKIHTLYLWKELESKVGTQARIRTDLLDQTAARIERDLHLLKRAGYINYDLYADYVNDDTGKTVYVVVIKDMSSAFIDLVKKARDIKVESR